MKLKANDQLILLTRIVYLVKVSIKVLKTHQCFHITINIHGPVVL